MSVVNALVSAALEVVNMVLDLYVWLLVISAILSWLVAFDIVNARQGLVRVVGDITYRMTEPLLRPIRRVLPPIGGIDLAPLVLIFGILFLQSFIRHLLVG